MNFCLIVTELMILLLAGHASLLRGGGKRGVDPDDGTIKRKLLIINNQIPDEIFGIPLPLLLLMEPIGELVPEAFTDELLPDLEDGIISPEDFVGSIVDSTEGYEDNLIFPFQFELPEPLPEVLVEGVPEGGELSLEGMELTAIFSGLPIP